jgi:hypothetical protein
VNTRTIALTAGMAMRGAAPDGRARNHGSLAPP